MLTSKQRAYLRGLANTMDPILHAGKGGTSDTMNKQADDALTARELIKGRVLETAPATPREVAEEIAAAVNAEVVQVIGRTFVLYRRNPKEPVIQLYCHQLFRPLGKPISQGTQSRTNLYDAVTGRQGGGDPFGHRRVDQEVLTHGF